MPGIRDEQWYLSPSFTEGAQQIISGQNSDIRFCGLLLDPSNAPANEKVKSVKGSKVASNDYDNPFKEVIDSLSESSKNRTLGNLKNLSIDFFDIPVGNGRNNSKSMLDELGELRQDHISAQLNLKSLHLTAIDLGHQRQMAPVADNIIASNLLIQDLILTFCRINDTTVKLLADALAVNRTIYHMNMNFNLLTKDGYLSLATGLNQNNTLRFLECKKNKAEKADLAAFIAKLSGNADVGEAGNQFLEFIDVGQCDDIDEKIFKNKIPETLEEINIPASKKKSIKRSEVTVELDTDEQGEVIAVPLNDAGEAVPAPAVEEVNINLVELVKTFVDRNKSSRKEREKVQKVVQLRGILDDESQKLSASFKHCKVLFLGPPKTGKTFFAHCLLHQLYEPPKDNLTGARIRQVNEVCFARVTELGWTKITSFEHVDAMLAKYLASLPENKRNRELANEVTFQFPKDVNITGKDLMISSALNKENEDFLARLKINNAKQKADAAPMPVFDASEKGDLIARFERKMEDTIEKALRENNYPSFSIFELDDGSKAFRHQLGNFINHHGMIYVFFSLKELKLNEAKVLNDCKNYINDIYCLNVNDHAQFQSKIFLVGTFLDEVLDDGLDQDLLSFTTQFKQMNLENDFDANNDPNSKSFMSFLAGLAKDDSEKSIISAVQRMLQVFNVNLMKEFSNAKFNASVKRNLVPNDDDDLMFFVVGNNLPAKFDSISKAKFDWDDLSGINRFRRKVRSLLDSEELEIISVMKSLREAKVVDYLVDRKNAPRKNPTDFQPDFITKSEFEKVCFSAGIASQAEIAILLRYLDVTGVVMWMTKSEILQNIIILNPKYLLSGLERFYNVLVNRDALAEPEQALIKQHGLMAEMDLLLANRVATHDLLRYYLLQKDNFEFLVELLKKSFHVNPINSTALKEIFATQNLYPENALSNSRDIQFETNSEYFLVANLGTNLSNDDDYPSSGNAEFPFKVKIVAAANEENEFGVGVFERTITLFVDNLQTPQVKTTLPPRAKNAFEFDNKSLTSARFTFDQDIMILTNNCNHMLAEFSSEKSVHLLFKFLQGVLRKLENEFVDNNRFMFGLYCMDLNGHWLPLDQAMKSKMKPYYYEAQNTSLLSANILANLDAL